MCWHLQRLAHFRPQALELLFQTPLFLLEPGHQLGQPIGAGEATADTGNRPTGEGEIRIAMQPVLLHQHWHQRGQAGRRRPAWPRWCQCWWSRTGCIAMRISPSPVGRLPVSAVASPAPIGWPSWCPGSRRNSGVWKRSSSACGRKCARRWRCQHIPSRRGAQAPPIQRQSTLSPASRRVSGGTTARASAAMQEESTPEFWSRKAWALMPSVPNSRRTRM